MNTGRINAILKNDEYRKNAELTRELEKDRIYCRHGVDHCLDVARIAALIAADEDYDVSRELIYAAAILHDIGRAEQYARGVQHELAGAEIAGPILTECGFTEEERQEITEAIAYHGDESVKDKKNLSGLIYRADKMSRRCFDCDAAGSCHKSAEKLIMEICY